MFYNARSRYILFGLILLVSLVFVVWQTGFNQISHNIFLIVNYLMFFVLFVLMLLFMLSMIKQRKVLLQKISQLTDYNNQCTEEIDNLRNALVQNKKDINQNSGIGDIAKHVMTDLNNSGQQNFSPQSICQPLLKALSKQFDLCCALFYYKEKHSGEFCVEGRYAIEKDVEIANIRLGEGLTGQVVKDGQARSFSALPVSYLKACSGLGESQEMNLYILPLMAKNSVVGVVEIGSFGQLPILAVWHELEDDLSSRLV